MVRITIELDDKLHEALQKKALGKAISMTELLPKMLEVYLEGEGYSRYLSY